MYLVTVESKVRFLSFVVLPPESVAAGWKQWEHVPNAAAVNQL